MLAPLYSKRQGRCELVWISSDRKMVYIWIWMVLRKINLLESEGSSRAVLGISSSSLRSPDELTAIWILLPPTCPLYIFAIKLDVDGLVFFVVKGSSSAIDCMSLFVLLIFVAATWLKPVDLRTMAPVFVFTTNFGSLLTLPILCGTASLV